MAYFENLPLISYNGHTVRNIIAKATLSDSTKSKTSIFYPYTITESDRIDVLADKYYDDPHCAWMIWLANDIIDPYYDLYVNDNDFNNFIIEKYQSIENAQSTIKCYINNWYGDTTVLSVNSYNNLSQGQKKYYNPVLNESLSIAHYVRKQKDWTVSTNKIMSLSLSASNNTMTVGEKIKAGSNSAFVTFANSSVITCQHVTGTIANNATLIGNDSGATATVSLATTIVENIPTDEYSFWTSYSYYDYQLELNASKKDIKLIDNRFKQTVQSELKRTMSI